MKIDLCEIFGVEEGEEFKIRTHENLYRIYNNKLQHFSTNTERWNESVITFNYVISSDIIKLPKKKFTDDELFLFKKVNKEYEWCARDKNGRLYLYEKKPYKKGDIWYYDMSESFNFYNHLFNSILWEDEEPVFIDDYVKRKDVD